MKIPSSRVDLSGVVGISPHMDPAPIRNKPLFFGLTLLSFGLLGLAIILHTV